MLFYSHSKKDKHGTTKGSKLLKDHVVGMLDKALSRLSAQVDLGLKKNDLRELLVLVIKLHDLGKYTTFFQNYLLDVTPVDQILKQHARIGGLVAYNLLKEKNEKVALLALYLIFLHHSKLVDITSIPGKLDNYLKRIIESQVQDLQPKIEQIESELQINGLSALVKYPNERVIRRAFMIWSKREQNIHNYFIVNYLFSLLIEADKLDASNTVLHQASAIPSNAVDNRFGPPSSIPKNKNLSSLSNNQLRNFCRAEVVSNIQRTDILDHYIFTLTAPTGVGKTMTALDFAIKLREKIRERWSSSPTIIYALPFINIIEQALKEYNTTLPEDTEILGHYQYADVFGKEKNEKDSISEEQNYNQKLMTLDTWQGDVIITSFVQFLETLIGNRNKLLKKFNHLAEAIIILDEVQTLRLDQMPLIGSALFYMARFLKARVILMTATKPKIFELAQQEILSKEGETVQPLELLTVYEQVFSCFERTKIIPLISDRLSGENGAIEFVKSIFSKQWQKDQACIIVCNTVNRSIEIFKTIKKHIEKKKLTNPVEYLSTNIVPAHRFERIQRIKDSIRKELAPILVSTQVVEAGVDLDFDMGFRDIGPIDSIIQVAGRVNRNNHPDKIHSPVFIVDFGDAQKIYGKITYEQSKKSLEQQEQYLESEYLKLISRYFDDISEKKSFSAFNKVFDSMKMLRYDSEIKEDKPVSSFRIIEESNSTQAVFIEVGEYEQELREKYLDKITFKMSKEKFDKDFKQDFQQRIITVPDYLAKTLPAVNEFDDNIKVVSNEVLGQYYDNETGFIRTEDSTVGFF